MSQLSSFSNQLHVIQLQETTRRIDVLDVLTTWEGESLPVHLDTRSRWIPPEGDSYPEQFNCPFRGCESTFATADECDNHVTLIQHSKQKVGNDKNWICRGTHVSEIAMQSGCYFISYNVL